MAGMAGKDDRIVAMSYNVCFGCMYSDKNSIQNRTSQTLAQHCVNRAIAQQRNVCLDNIQTVFQNTELEFGPLDLVGIQESTNWALIIQTPALSNLSYIHHKEKFEDMISLYNSDIFNLDAFITGDIGKNEGRPYQILFLTHKISNKKYIFINIHNNHHNNPRTLEQSLSNTSYAYDIKPHIKQKSFQDCQKIPQIDKIDYKNIISQNTYDIIFMGDTNYHNKNNIWDVALAFTPLKDININVSVSSHGQRPPNTCCVGSASLRKNKNDPMYGDYILISDNLNYEQNNIIPLSFNPDATSFPTSDHLPIVSVINLPSLKVREQVFIVNTDKTLRLQDNLLDPNAIGNDMIDYKGTIYPFKGMQISANMKLVYPNGKITENNLVFVQTKEDPNKIGYINSKYLNKINDNEYKLNVSSRTLRLQNNDADPNGIGNEIIEYKGTMYPFKGMTINNKETLFFPNGITTKNNLVIVQDKDDPNIIGYIRDIYLTPFTNGGRIRKHKNNKKSIKKKHSNKKSHNKKSIKKSHNKKSHNKKSIKKSIKKSHNKKSI